MQPCQTQTSTPVKRLIVLAIEVICILPATVSLPFVFGGMAAIRADSSGSVGLSEALGIAIGISIVFGVTASWVMIVWGTKRSKTSVECRTALLIGLFVGVLGGCALLVWVAKFLSDQREMTA